MILIRVLALAGFWAAGCFAHPPLLAAPRDDLKKGLYFRGTGALPFGSQIRSVRELIDRLLTRGLLTRGLVLPQALAPILAYAALPTSMPPPGPALLSPDRLPTPRLWLEPQLPCHAPEMYRLLCDPALYTFEHAPPDSEAALRQRFERLASRRSPDGRQHWLNWVLRLRSDGALIGFVQATVRADGRALVAYVLGSGHWGQGLATEAVRAMLLELNSVWQVPQALAVFKRANQRSRALLQRLGFAEPGAAEAEGLALDADEDLLVLHLPG